MLRKVTFKCDNCKKTFSGGVGDAVSPIIIPPVRCPHCGSYHTAPVYNFLMKPLYKLIWEKLDQTPGKN